MSFLPPGLHQCHYCQGCFPTQAALGLHLILHNKLLALEASQPAATPQPPPVPSAAASAVNQATAFVPPLPPAPAVAFNAPLPLTGALQASVLPPLPPPLPPGAVAAPVAAPKAPIAAESVPAGFVRGVVVYYNVARSFGTIKRAGSKDKVHFYLTACDFLTPTPVKGEQVVLAEKRGPKGPIATSVVRTRGASTDFTSFVPGTVTLYQVLGGFGTITTDAGTELSFRGHSCDVVRPPPTVGERVMAKPGVGPKGPIATEVRRGSVQATDKDKPKPKAAANHSGKIHAAKLSASVSLGERIADQTREMLQEVPSVFGGGKHPRYVYVDLDNIWISFTRAEHIVGKYPGAESTRDLVLYLEGLSRRLCAGEEGSSVARLIAFYYKTPAAIANGLRKFGRDDVTWEVRKQETASDTTMQLELLNAKRPCAAHWKTLVLVTGDGNVAPNGMCFREILDQYLRDGWFVEVHAWLATMARSYIEFQREYSSTVVIRPLDDALEQIVVPKKVYDARMSKASSTASSTVSEDDATPLIRAIVTKYEVRGGFGTVAKLDGSGGELHLSILNCDIRRPPPVIGEQVMVTEGVNKKWGPCATTVRRVTIASDSDNSELKASKPVDSLENGIETKVAHTINDSHALGPVLPSQHELSAALTRAMDMMAVDPNSTGVISGDQHEQAAEPSDASSLPDEFENLIRMLSDPDEYEAYIPAAITRLELTHPEEAATIREMDAATQRILLLHILQDEVDSTTVADLAVETLSTATLSQERSVSSPPSSPVGLGDQPVDHDSPLLHPDPEPEPSCAMRCDKCSDEIPIDDIVTVAGCDHVYCSRCLRNYAVARVGLDDVNPLCPREDCASVLSDVDLARVLSIDEQKKYYETRMQLAVGSSSEASTSF